MGREDANKTLSITFPLLLHHTGGSQPLPWSIHAKVTLSNVRREIDGCVWVQTLTEGISNARVCKMSHGWDGQRQVEVGPLSPPPSISSPLGASKREELRVRTEQTAGCQ